MQLFFSSFNNLTLSEHLYFFIEIIFNLNEISSIHSFDKMPQTQLHHFIKSLLRELHYESLDHQKEAVPCPAQFVHYSRSIECHRVPLSIICTKLDTTSDTTQLLFGYTRDKSFHICTQELRIYYASDNSSFFYNFNC